MERTDLASLPASFTAYALLCSPSSGNFAICVLSGSLKDLAMIMFPFYAGCQRPGSGSIHVDGLPQAVAMSCPLVQVDPCDVVGSG